MLRTSNPEKPYRNRKKKSKYFPFHIYKEWALGIFGWGPKDFWSATIWDIEDAQVGYLVSKGVNLKQSPKEPLDKAFLEKMKRKFPDGHN